MSPAKGEFWAVTVKKEVTVASSVVMVAWVTVEVVQREVSVQKLLVEVSVVTEEIVEGVVVALAEEVVYTEAVVEA